MDTKASDRKAIIVLAVVLTLLAIVTFVVVGVTSAQQAKQNHDDVTRISRGFDTR